MKLLGSSENKITKDKNGENVPHLEITEVVLVYCNIVNNDYQQNSRALYTFVPNKAKRAIQKPAEATGDLTGNKIADKVTGRVSPMDLSVSKRSNKKLSNDEIEADVERVSTKKRYISPEERQQIIVELRLI